MTRPRGTDGSLLSSLPLTLAALALALLPHLQFLPVWITGAFVTCCIYRIVVERRRGSLPPTWLRGSVALLCFLGVLFTYDTISGVGPGTALLAVMASLKLLETGKRRDQFVLLFIAIFLVMASLLREQYLWSLPYLLFALAVIMAAWLRMAAEPSEPLSRSARTGGRLMLYALPLALAMWFFFPRISSPFWAVPIDTSSGVSGLSTSMSPGDISSLSLSNAVAFRARFFDDIPEPRDRYWRAMVLHRFNGRTWNAVDPIPDRDAVERIEVRGAATRYEITMEPTRQHWVPALEMPQAWNLPRTFMTPRQTLSNMHPIDQRVAFEISSFADYTADAGISTFFRGWYLDLPEGSNPASVRFAEELRARSASDDAYIEAILAMFRRDEYFYTLQPPALGRNPVDEFLFETRRGFCEHYASAFAVMMRAAGIPARVVVGYQGGEVNPMGGRLIVRQSDAHAWSEVWLDDRGWTRVDPTAAVAPERIERGLTDSLFDGFGAQWGIDMPSQFMHRLTLTWDVLNANWNDWVLGFGPDKQREFMEALGFDNPTWRKMLLTLIFLVIAMTLAISLLLHMRNRPPPRDRAVILYNRFVRKTGIPAVVGETPIAFAGRAREASKLDGATIDAVTASYLDVRYGGRGEAALKQLERDVSAISAP